MDLYNNPLKSFLNYIDNGSFFKRPMQIYYILCGALTMISILVLTIVLSVYLVKFLLNCEGWSAFVGWITFVIYWVLTIIMAFSCLLYWWYRSKELVNQSNKGNRIVALPLWGHFVQTGIESFGVYFALFCSQHAICLLVYTLLSGDWGLIGGVGVSNDFSLMGLIFILLGFVITLLVIWGFAYIFILLAHVIGESIRIKANIANDTRDMGDIMRSSTIK